MASSGASSNASIEIAGNGILFELPHSRQFCPHAGVDASWELAGTSLWKDVLGVHSRKPLHCMVGGGDQLYQDGFFQVSVLPPPNSLFPSFKAASTMLAS